MRPRHRALLSAHSSKGLLSAWSCLLILIDFQKQTLAVRAPRLCLLIYLADFLPPLVFFQRFKFQALINGRPFPPAEAGSKKLAKQEAAANAMKILMQEAENGNPDGLNSEMPFVSDSSELEQVNLVNLLFEFGQTVLVLNPISSIFLLQPSHSEPELSPASAQLNLLPGKHPISVLMEYGQKSGNTIEFLLLSQDGPSHDPRYGMLLSALGRMETLPAPNTLLFSMLPCSS